MVWFDERRRKVAEWPSLLVPSVEKKVGTAIERARHYRILRAADHEFEVISEDRNLTVNIRQHECSCKRWQTQGGLAQI